MRRGFSLLEISIVLAIMGLLVGSIIAGKSLIRASELRRYMNDANKYRSLVYGFRERYFYMPGDMNNATRFWPTATNGNGDGKIYAAAEQVSAWQMMSLSGMVDQSYAGTWTASGYNPPGTNCPAANDGKGCYILESAVLTSQSWSLYQNMDNHIRIGGVNSTNTAGTLALFNGEEAYNIDMKIDDGNAETGKLMGTFGTNPATGTAAGAYCVNNSASNPPDPTKSYYLLSPSTVACILFYYF